MSIRSITRPIQAVASSSRSTLRYFSYTPTTFDNPKPAPKAKKGMPALTKPESKSKADRKQYHHVPLELSLQDYQYSKINLIQSLYRMINIPHGYGLCWRITRRNWRKGVKREKWISQCRRRD